MELSHESPQNLPEHLSYVTNAPEFIDIDSDILICDPEEDELAAIVETFMMHLPDFDEYKEETEAPTPVSQLSAKTYILSRLLYFQSCHRTAPKNNSMQFSSQSVNYLNKHPIIG